MMLTTLQEGMQLCPIVKALLTYGLECLDIVIH